MVERIAAFYFLQINLFRNFSMLCESENESESESENESENESESEQMSITWI